MRLNALRAFATMALAFALAFPPLPAQASTDDLEVALGLATMLRSARTVIAVNQDHINDPAVGDKGLDR